MFPNQLSSVFWILLLGLVFRTIIAFWLPPGYDEGYYYLYTQHLDWSYFDHPVFVALTTGLGIWITGIVSPFTLRIGTLILYTASLLLMYLTSARLFKVKAAKITLILASIIPIFQIGFGVVTLPDSPLIFFWSATLCCAVYEFFPLADKSYVPSYRLSILGILIGLACLSKYHGFFLGFSLVAFCVSSKTHRRALVSPWTGLGLILFVLTLFPLILWNFQHDWASFRFQFFDRFLPIPNAPKKDYNLLNALAVFGVGIALLFPTIGFPLWWVTFKSLLQQLFVPLRKVWTLPLEVINHRYFWEKQLLIFWISLPLTLGLIILGGKQQILVTWPMPGFWGAILLLGLYGSSWENYSQFWVKWWLKGSAIAISTLLVLILIHINTGIFFKESNYPFFEGFLTP